MNEYSFLSGVVDGSVCLYDYCKTQGFEKVYESIPEMLKGVADNVTKKSLMSFLSEIATRINPNVNRSDYFKRLNLGIKVSEYLNDLNTTRLVEKSINIINKLKSSYDVCELDPENYNSGIIVLEETLNEKINSIPFVLKDLVAMLSNKMGFNLDKTFNESKIILEKKLLPLRPVIE
jgi:hypothetical protein